MNYYTLETCKKILNAVEDPQWRVWKVVDEDGRVRQNKSKMTNEKKLLKHIGTKADKVYVSVGKWVQPEKVYGKNIKKSVWLVGDNLFIGSDLLFDIDNEDLNAAHQDAVKILEWMNREPGYKLMNIRYSGTKGFHLLFKDMYPIRCQNPIKRLKETEQKRRQLVERMPEIESIDEIHKNIICDQYRVHAALYSVKKATNHIVQEIPYNDFISLDIEGIRAKYILPASQVAMTGCESINTSRKGKAGTGITAYPYNYHFVDNTVRGTKNQYITVLKYPINKDVTPIIQELQSVYNLSDFYSFTYNNIQILLNPKLVCKRRLEKILRRAKAMNLNSFLYYGHIWIPIDNMESKEVIASEYGHNDTHSRPHLRLLGVEDYYHNLAGSEENRICRATVWSD